LLIYRGYIAYEKPGFGWENILWKILIIITAMGKPTGFTEVNGYIDSTLWLFNIAMGNGP